MTCGYSIPGIADKRDRAMLESNPSSLLAAEQSGSLWNLLQGFPFLNLVCFAKQSDKLIAEPS